MSIEINTELRRVNIATVPEEVRNDVQAKFFNRQACLDLISFLAANTAHGDNAEFLEEQKQEHRMLYIDFSTAFENMCRIYAPDEPRDGLNLDFMTCELYKMVEFPVLPELTDEQLYSAIKESHITRMNGHAGDV